MTELQEEFQEYLCNKLNLQELEYDDLVHKIHVIITKFVKEHLDEDISKEMN